MKTKLLALALVLLLAAKGSDALPKGREMEGLQLITALALDGGGTDVTATAVTGVRASEEEEPQVFTAAGENMAQAIAALRESSARRAYLGQTEQLLLGEDADPAQALELVVRHRELRLDTLLYIVRGEAGPGLAASAGRMAAETGGQDPLGRTVGEVLPRLTQGEYTLVPALAAGEDGGLGPAGWAVLGPDGVETYLEGAAAQGARLLLGLGAGETVVLSGGTVELTGVRTWARAGKVCCTLTARVVQGSPTGEALGAWGEARLRAALAPGLDCWGLDREMAALCPWRWTEWKGTDVKMLQAEGTGRLVEE